MLSEIFLKRGIKMIISLSHKSIFFFFLSFNLFVNEKTDRICAIRLRARARVPLSVSFGRA